MRDLSIDGRVVHFEFLFESLRDGSVLAFKNDRVRVRVNSSGFGMLNTFSILPPELHRQRESEKRDYGVKSFKVGGLGFALVPILPEGFVVPEGGSTPIKIDDISGTCPGRVTRHRLFMYNPSPNMT